MKNKEEKRTKREDVQSVASPWDMVMGLGIYTQEDVDEMTWSECIEVLTQER